MEQLLSQEEINALLGGFSDGDEEQAGETIDEAAAKPVETRLFDLAKYTKGRKERLPALDFITDRFSKSLLSALSLSLSSHIRRVL